MVLILTQFFLIKNTCTKLTHFYKTNFLKPSKQKKNYIRRQKQRCCFTYMQKLFFSFPQLLKRNGDILKRNTEILQFSLKKLKLVEIIP